MPPMSRCPRLCSPSRDQGKPVEPTCPEKHPPASAPAPWARNTAHPSNAASRSSESSSESLSEESSSESSSSSSSSSLEVAVPERCAAASYWTKEPGLTAYHRVSPGLPAALVPSLRYRDRRSRAQPLRQTPRADGSPAGGSHRPPAGGGLPVQPQAAPGSRRTAGSPPGGAAPRGKVRGGAARGGPQSTFTRPAVSCHAVSRALPPPASPCSVLSRRIPCVPPPPASRPAAPSPSPSPWRLLPAALGSAGQSGLSAHAPCRLGGAPCPAPPLRDGTSGCGRGATPPSSGAPREPERAEGPSADPAVAAAAMVREGPVRRGQHGARGSPRGGSGARPPPRARPVHRPALDPAAWWDGARRYRPGLDPGS